MSEGEGKKSGFGKILSVLGNSKASVLIGAALLMATSAIGPGFITQTTKFTEQHKSAFAFVIVMATLASLVAQLNVWRIIAVTKLRGQDVSNKVLPGLGYVIAALVAMGGLAFNIGNVGGAAMGIQTFSGLNPTIGAIIVGILGVVIFYSKNIGAVVDKFSQITGAIMLVLITYVVIVSSPPLFAALGGIVSPITALVDNSKFTPEVSMDTLGFTALTIIGGTVGGYITFSGGHRLVDANIVGEENLKEVTRSASLGMGVATFVRILLFLATLGVVSGGVTLDPSNPAVTVFETAAGPVGKTIFGIILFSESLNSVVGAAYTSVSFLKTLSKFINKNENWVIIAFILVSALIFVIVGQPVKVLVVVGALNGLILPLTLGTVLVASKRKDIVGDYKHPMWLLILGVIVVLVMAFMGIRSLGNIATLWTS